MTVFRPNPSWRDDFQIEQYFDLYPCDRFLIMNLAELQRDPVGVVKAISDFLGVDATGFGSEMPFTSIAPAYEVFDSESDALIERYFGDLDTRPMPLN